MIETDEFKIAENPIVALFENTRKAALNRIKGYEDALIIEKAVVEMCKSKLQSMKGDDNDNES